MNNKITPEKKRALDKAFTKFIAKSLWNGVHHALMATVMTLILIMVNATYFGDSDHARLIGLVLIALFIITRLNRNFAIDFMKFNAEVKSIIKE